MSQCAIQSSPLQARLTPSNPLTPTSSSGLVTFLARPVVAFFSTKHIPYLLKPHSNVTCSWKPSLIAPTRGSNSDPHVPNMPLYMYTLTSNYKCWHQHQEVPLPCLVCTSCLALLRVQVFPGLWTAHPQDLSYSWFHSHLAGRCIFFGLPVPPSFLITCPDGHSFFLASLSSPPTSFLTSISFLESLLCAEYSLPTPVPRAQICSQTTWVLILPPPLPSCVISGKLLNFSVSYFLMCKMRLIMIPTSQNCWKNWIGRSSMLRTDPGT